MNINIKAKHPFWLKGGKPLHTLRDLHDELKIMPRDIFDHHVNAHKNDFAAWTKHSIGHERLAQKLEQAKSPREHEMHLRDALFPQNEKNAPEQKKTPPQPAIIHSENKTPLIVSTPRQVHVSNERSRLRLTHAHERIHSENKTRLHLREPHEKHPSTLLAASYVALGIVSGCALTILFLL
ncbi:hypothetical protein C4580_04775 [Candidatus Woesearchaeota archaeon]|nr:MAG: hypothetical protein C4580_04775 [Candidatus Woesearchaeota archaeon]